MSEFLREAAILQPALLKSLQTLHRRANAAIEEAAIADTVLDAREIAAAAEAASGGVGGPQPAGSSALRVHTEPSATSSVNPLRSLQAPDAYSVKPLVELELLALRAAQMLRRRHATERRLSVIVTGLTGVFIGVGLYLALFAEQLAPALILIVGAALAFVLLRWKWRPYRRAARSLHLVDLAEELSSNLRGRLRALEGIPDHPTRHLQQWQAVLELTEPVCDLWA
jgi:Flp pilus assembly protein TadB